MANNKEKMKLSELFDERPDTWGLRGDKFFWKYLKELAENMELLTADELEKWIKDEYFSLSGVPMGDTYLDVVYVERFAQEFDGGMSNGCLSGWFWSTKGIPLLQSRLEKLCGTSRTPSPT